MPTLYSKALPKRRQRILQLLLQNDRLVTVLLKRHGKLGALPSADTRSACQELLQNLQPLHAADIADILESLPEEARQALWQLIPTEARGKVMLETSEPVWQSLIAPMSDQQILSALAPLDLDDQAWLARFLPRDLTGRLLASLKPIQRSHVIKLSNYDRDSIAQVMDFNFIVMGLDLTLGQIQQHLQQRAEISIGTDKLFITDENNRLLGELLLSEILIKPATTPVQQVMNRQPVTFSITEKAEHAVSAFEKYNLISAAVTDPQGHLLGRVAIEDIIDLLNQENDSNIRKMVGLRQEEDVFAPVSKTFQSRSAWLLLNICTAFLASRVIGLFEHTIAQLVALATLMPIVAGIGGNTGNQTITMIVRALALHQIEQRNFRFLLIREMNVALVNGLCWGAIMGAITWLLYHNLPLSGVMLLAITLNLMLAALMGVLIPLIMTKLKRDPAIGSSVLITAITDTGGFFIFLGLATCFLL